jgi:hypothetical protein
MVPVIQQRNITLKPWLYEKSTEPLPCRLLLIHRLADLRPELSHDQPDNTATVTVTSGGTILARIIDLPQTSPRD